MVHVVSHGGIISISVLGLAFEQTGGDFRAAPTSRTLAEDVHAVNAHAAPAILILTAGPEGSG
jgi:hypothetical protein